MAVNLKGRHFLTLMDFTPEEIRYMLDLAHDLKAKKRAGFVGDTLKGKNVVLLFEKTSTRTRCAFEVAALDEGAHVTFLDSKSSQMGKKETIADTAKVLGRFYDGIEYRGFKQSVVEELAANAGVPVWNGLTDVDHFVAYGPQELADQIDQDVLRRAREVAEYTGASIEVSSDEACLKGADVLYTDIWASMGEEDQIPDRVRMLTPFKVTKEMLDKTENDDVIFMHCLPSFHDFDTTMAAEQKELGYDIREVTDEVFLSRHSKVFDEAENRMHTIKAVMVATIGR